MPYSIDGLLVSRSYHDASRRRLLPLSLEILSALLVLPLALNDPLELVGVLGNQLP